MTNSVWFQKFIFLLFVCMIALAGFGLGWIFPQKSSQTIQYTTETCYYKGKMVGVISAVTKIDDSSFRKGCVPDGN